MTSKHVDDFYCLTFLPSFRTYNKLKSHENAFKNQDFCGIVLPSKKDNKLEFNQYIKSKKMPYTIYADLESLIKKYMYVQKIQSHFFRTFIVKYISTW